MRNYYFFDLFIQCTLRNRYPDSPVNGIGVYWETEGQLFYDPVFVLSIQDQVQLVNVKLLKDPPILISKLYPLLQVRYNLEKPIQKATVTMSQNNGHNQMKPEFLSDPAPLSSDEQAYLRTLLSEEDLEKCYEGHCEAAHRKLWTHFQVIGQLTNDLH